MKYFPAGVCYTAQQCKELHGEAKGSCARGFGTCCVFRYNGADRNRQEVLERKISYIENPSKSVRSLTQSLDIKANNKGGIKLETPTWTFTERHIFYFNPPPLCDQSERFSK